MSESGTLVPTRIIEKGGPLDPELDWVVRHFVLGTSDWGSKDGDYTYVLDGLSTCMAMNA